MKKSYKYRLSPTRKQAQTLQWMLDRCRELYNASLQERRDAYRMAGKSITYYDQASQLPEIKQVREEYQDIHSQVLQDVLRKADKAFKSFFARCKRGDIPGFPRYKGKGNFDSFTYPQVGFSLTADNRVCLSKIGSIKVKMHRPIEGIIKTCTVKREGENWYVVFACEVERVTDASKSIEGSSEVNADHIDADMKMVGIDLGVTHLATLSTGETIDHPHHFRKGEKKLARLHQALARKKRGSNRRKKAVKAVAKAHRKIRNQRKDFLHKQSHHLVHSYHVIVFEDLQTANLTKRPKPKQDENGTYLHNGAAAKGGLNKSILDAGWGQFVAMCSYKAESAGRTLLQVNPKFTSQACSGCGQVRKKTLAERWHSCECGCELDRDHNAAINILRLGQRQREQSRE